MSTLRIGKVAINTTHAHFILSPHVMAMYADQSGIPIQELEFTYDRKRDDPILISILEKLGTSAWMPPAEHPDQKSTLNLDEPYYQKTKLVVVKVVEGYYKIVEDLEYGTPTGLEGVEFCDTLHFDMEKVMSDPLMTDTEKGAMFVAAYHEMIEAKELWKKEKCGRELYADVYECNDGDGNGNGDDAKKT